MAGSITLALWTAQSGLLASQAGLDIVANNIANVNTPGYSRKVTTLEQRVLASAGAGVEISEVVRKVDEGLQRSMRIEVGEYNELDIQMSYYERVQQLFGEPADNGSISHLVEELTQAIETLATTPERAYEQSEVMRRARTVGIKLEQMTLALQDLRQQADKQISDVAVRVSTLTKEIEDLNNKIIRNDAVSHDVTDLLDKRDQAVDELSKYMDIHYFLRNENDLVVFTSGGYTLVDSTGRTMSHVATTQLNPTVTHAKGNINGIFLSGGSSADDITNYITRGQVKGLVDMRDSILPDLQSQIDELAAELRDQLNAIHNRGQPFPGSSSMTGTRTFVAPGTQTIRLTGTDDVVIAVTDETGVQVAQSRLRSIMNTATGDSDGPWTINQVASGLQTWLQANGGSASTTVSVNSDGKLVISMSTTDRYLTIRDESGTSNGSTRADITVGYDADGEGTVDYNVSGFSSFFGLNDFITDNLEPNRYDSEIKDTTYAYAPSSSVVLTFTDGTTTDSVTLYGGRSYTLQQIADAINDSERITRFITATVMPDGSGYRLRLEHNNGAAFTINDDQGVGATNSVIEALVMGESNARVSQFFGVRSDIIGTPSLETRGNLQWDSARGATGEYYMSIGDNTVIQEMAEMMTSSNAFDAAGGLFDQSVTFAEFGAAITSYQAGIASTAEADRDSELKLSDSLRQQSDNYRGVNLDEEMSNLLVFQQSFSAAARVISTIKEMFERLEQAVS